MLLFLCSSHHVMTLLLDGKLYTAPITDNPENIIDIGTGTGKFPRNKSCSFRQ